MERTVDANGLRIWCETFGKPADPAVLLIMGLGAQGVAWPEPLCQRIADNGRYVIRYDQRDVGLSSSVDFETNPYTFTDLAADAVGLLTGLEIAAAHVVGASMGGMVAQEIALEYSARMLSMTCIMSTAEPIDPSTGTFRGAVPDPRIVAWQTEYGANPPQSAQARVDSVVELARINAGTLEPFDEAAQRMIIELEDKRGDRAAAAANHTKAALASRDRAGLVSSIGVPTLVIHGTEDVMAPPDHGAALASAIAGSTFLTIEGMGHELPATAFHRIVTAIIDHTGG
ncbi:pimeloyl-ACP methyl ester carboxylesterase [Tamaricihabitans halophyticus]|uniref:Pimeloyl-ACP methyl ester carboxylesterase n=1 Tax=Tamaricihabitans halophyticus TaxID=1262583 RepID=A0A4R2QW43_9PSEU|nr:alpha/beta hydrolase [Tamaricihabitans halophyticus]TCP53474.1 pimeloyl-ACP methyl ester carboxylesterase [Tamaricihabitans halophyticus]